MITLHLRCRLATSREAVEEFFARARASYEAPGGITGRLLWSLDDPACFVEVFEYEDRAVYEADQVRVAHDPAMLALLAEWHTHLVRPAAGRDVRGRDCCLRVMAVRSKCTL